MSLIQDALKRKDEEGGGKPKLRPVEPPPVIPPPMPPPVTLPDMPAKITIPMHDDEPVAAKPAEPAPAKKKGRGLPVFLASLVFVIALIGAAGWLILSALKMTPGGQGVIETVKAAVQKKLPGGAVAEAPAKPAVKPAVITPSKTEAQPLAAAAEKPTVAAKPKPAAKPAVPPAAVTTGAVAGVAAPVVSEKPAVAAKPKSVAPAIAPAAPAAPAPAVASIPEPAPAVAAPAPVPAPAAPKPLAPSAAKAVATKPATRAVAATKAPAKWPSLRVVGVMAGASPGSGSGTAIINGTVVNEHDEVEGARLIEVNQAGVVFTYQAETQFVRVGQTSL